MPLSTPDQITIEKTPKYLVDKRAPGRAFEMNPNLKLIVVMRDPVVRAVSEYVQSQWRARRLLNERQRRDLNDSQRFEQMAFKVVAPIRTRRLATSNTSIHRSIRSEWPSIRNGLYALHLRPWLERFARSQFLFVNGERLISDPSAELNRVEAFLGLDSVLRPEHFVRRKSGGFACILKPLDGDDAQVKCLSEQKGRPHPRIDRRVIDQLRDFYRPFNKQLFDMIGETEPWWPV